MFRIPTRSLWLLFGLSLVAPPRAAAQAPPPGSSCPLSSCGTPNVSGVVVGQTWTTAGSPYCITGDTQFSAVTIQSGVCILIDGPWRIDVLSSLNARGTLTAPITFTAKNQNPLVRWKGIRFQNTAPGSIMAYCRVEYAESSGITIIDSNPTIKHCTLSNNLATGASGNNNEGGGINISVASGNLELQDCLITDNSSASHGGGIRAIMGTGTLRLTRSLVTRNTADYPNQSTGHWFGGGLRISGSSMIKNCEFTENTVKGLNICFNCGVFYTRGGGIHSDTGICTLETSVVRDNLARYDCGGNCNFINGIAQGGGIALDSGTLNLTNSIVSGNTATGFSGSTGGGIVVNSGTASITNSTIARNNVHGLHINGGTVDILNSILFYNNTSGAQIAGTPTITYSDIQGGSPPAGMGNITFSPAFAGTGNESSDLRIIPGSPCIDAGNPAALYNDTCLPPSQPCLGTSRNDMGAHGGPVACDWITNALCAVQNYCTSTTNSSGVPATMSWSGTTSVSANNFVLIARTCPPNKNGFFFYGRTQITPPVPLGAGLRCVGTPFYRLPLVNTGPSGTATFPLNYANLPLAGPIASGDARNFQFWFRDPPGNPALPTNTTDGLEVFFCP